MRALGIAGWSGAGKTTLIEGVLPLLTARGITVSTLKHTHHDFDVDRPGKDSHRHRSAGAREVLLVGGARWALLHEGPPPPLTVLLDLLEPVDLVLVEGYRREALPKLEVFRASLGRPPLWPDHPEVAAVAADPPVVAAGRTVLALSDHAAVAGWIARWIADTPAGIPPADAAPHIATS